LESWHFLYSELQAAVYYFFVLPGLMPPLPGILVLSTICGGLLAVAENFDFGVRGRVVQRRNAPVQGVGDGEVAPHGASAGQRVCGGLGGREIQLAVGFRGEPLRLRSGAA
jgi:hypothetical protein